MLAQLVQIDLCCFKHLCTVLICCLLSIHQLPHVFVCLFEGHAGSASDLSLQECCTTSWTRHLPDALPCRGHCSRGMAHYLNYVNSMVIINPLLRNGSMRISHQCQADPAMVLLLNCSLMFQVET